MDWRENYRDKLISVEEAAQKVRSGDIVASSIASGVPCVMIDAIAEYAYENLENVTLYMGGQFKPYKAGLPKYKGHLDLKMFFNGPVERKVKEMGSSLSYQAVHLSNTTADRLNKHRPNVLVVSGTAPENGIISLGPSPIDVALLDICDTVIVQVNKQMPFVYGVDCMFPVERVTYLVEADEEMPVLRELIPSEEEEKMAAYICELIPDGACIQLGIGGTARAVGKGLKNKRDLGLHTELFTSTLSELMRCGVINNSRKNFFPGKSLIGFTLGNQETYQFMDHNPDIETRPFSWINDPRIIAQNDNMISINGALQVDLTGQVCAESIGLKQYSGTGGQADYIRGARMSKGGKSFLALPSTFTNKNGELVSKISLALPLGSVVTTPRTDVHYIVTEYGVADLQDEPLDVRVKRMIEIAHPDFRDQLTHEAKVAGFII